MEAGGVKRCGWGPRGGRQRGVLPARFLRVCVCESSRLAALSRSLQAPGGASPFLASWGG